MNFLMIAVLALQIGRLLTARKETVACAESCTGGYLAHCLTNISGASQYFLGGIVSYADKVKVDWLGVKPETLALEGAVSRAVVEEMSLGVRKGLHADYGLATSGIAGPTGGSAEKPLGTVYMGIAYAAGIIIEKGFFPEGRMAFKEQVIEALLQRFQLFLQES